MYTQCEHCKAIFHVNMREVTVAKGRLRCGECLKVFTATKTLSTTIPDRFVGEVTKLNIDTKLKHQPKKPENTTRNKEQINTSSFEIDIREQNLASNSRENKNTNARGKGLPSKTKINRKTWPLILTIALSLLLFGQILYHFRNIILNTPVREPEKIQMVTHNVFVHPKESGVLLITATIENTADHSQPYPLLELSLNNSQSTIVALRRFRPEEYLETYTKGTLFPSNTTTTLKLKIKDPGNTATRFQFSFL